MNSKQRVEKTLSFQEADRVPYDYWAVKEITEKLLDHFGLDNKDALLDKLGIDFRYVEGPSYTGQQLKKFDDGSVEDLWGVRRKLVEIEGNGGSYKHLMQSPLERLETVEEIERHRWPSAGWWDYSGLRKECEKHQNYAAVNAGDRLDRTAQLKPMMYLRGMEQTYIDLAVNPKIAEAIIAHIKEYFLEYNRRVFEEAGKPGGGFIISTAHNIQADTPLKNVLALYQAYQDYGRY